MTQTVTSATFPVSYAIAEKSLNLQVIIDFGNGDLKGAIRINSRGYDWEKIIFPSLVAKLSVPMPGCFQIGDDYYLVGTDAKRAECVRTGATESGKIDNALPLLINALRKVHGTDVNLNIDLIYTSPSVKQYGPLINKAVEGEHIVVTPQDDLNLVDGHAQQINLNKIVPQLEGHRAIEVIRDQLGGESQIFLCDVGNRTIIPTLVDKLGRVLARKAFDSCGVRGIASRIVADEALAGVAGIKLCPDEDDVINFILGKNGKKVRAKIEPQIKACVGEVTGYMEQTAPDAPIFLLGGGAELPGLDKLLAASIIDDPQWATVDGLSSIADALIKRA